MHILRKSGLCKTSRGRRETYITFQINVQPRHSSMRTRVQLVVNHSTEIGSKAGEVQQMLRVNAFGAQAANAQVAVIDAAYADAACAR